MVAAQGLEGAAQAAAAGYAAIPAAAESAGAEAAASTLSPRERAGRRPLLRAALAAALSAALAAGAAVGWLGARGERLGRLRSQQLPAEIQAVMEAVEAGGFQGRCQLVEQNVDYELHWADKEAFGLGLDHIPSPDMCCAMCHGVPQCKSWTWVKNALPDGCPSQCWLKGGVPKTKVPKAGVVSGLPPPRPVLDKAQVAAAIQVGGGSPSVFCWSLMLPFGYEMELLKFQHDVQGSIFACDASAVYSNRSVTVAPGLQTTVVDVDLTVKFGGDSYSALNTWIFIAIWKKVLDEGWHKTYDWIVKVDPDAVFFPDRLRPVIAAHPTTGYINNCRFGLHGPIEVIAAKTMERLKADYDLSWDKKSPETCVKGLHFGQWGEDFFISQCMKKVYQIAPETDEKLMCEAHCVCDKWYWCAEGTDRVTYHPFKRADMYSQCMANALAGQAGAVA